MFHGWDRLRLQGTLRSLYHPSVMEYYLRQANICGRISRPSPPPSPVASAGPLRPWPCPPAPADLSALQPHRKEPVARHLQQRDNVARAWSRSSVAWSRATPGLRAATHHPKLELKLQWGKCIHLYFYWIHEDVGCLHLRLQTWFPFLIQVCLNGREWLARQMDPAGMGLPPRGELLSLDCRCMGAPKR